MAVATDGVGVAALDSEALFEGAGAAPVFDDGVDVDDEDALRGLTGATISCGKLLNLSGDRRILIILDFAPLMLDLRSIDGDAVLVDDMVDGWSWLTWWERLCGGSWVAVSFAVREVAPFPRAMSSKSKRWPARFGPTWFVRGW